MRTLILAAAALTLLVTPAATPAATPAVVPAVVPADHGHSCVWSSGQWIGAGVCPGMPGFVPHTDPPTRAEVPEPPPKPVRATTRQAPTTAPTADPPTPRPVAPRTATTRAPAPTTSRTIGCVRSYGQFFCTGGALPPANVATPAPRTPAPVVTAP